jgi:hypothetical protein
MKGLYEMMAIFLLSGSLALAQGTRSEAGLSMGSSMTSRPIRAAPLRRPRDWRRV